MGLNEKSREFVDAVKSTAEFAKLKQVKAEIDKNRTLKSQVMDFNRKQTELYNSKLSAKEVEERVAELNKKFTELSKIPEVDMYLKASKQFNDMMAKVYKNMNDSIEAEIKFK